MNERLAVSFTLKQLLFLADHLISNQLRHSELIDICCSSTCESAEHIAEQRDFYKNMLIELSEIPQIKAIDDARIAWIKSIR
jgi:hypothetical protein